MAVYVMLNMCSGIKLLAANAAGSYPVTCRTRKSSLRALMVLCGVRTGEQTVASLDYIQERKFTKWASSFLCVLNLHAEYFASLSVFLLIML